MPEHHDRSPGLIAVRNDQALRRLAPPTGRRRPDRRPRNPTASDIRISVHLSLVDTYRAPTSERAPSWIPEKCDRRAAGGLRSKADFENASTQFLDLIGGVCELDEVGNVLSDALEDSGNCTFGQLVLAYDPERLTPKVLKLSPKC